MLGVSDVLNRESVGEHEDNEREPGVNEGVHGSREGEHEVSE